MSAGAALSPRIYADLIGKPFVHGGRGPAEFDCWGLLQTVLRRAGHEPTDYPSNPELLRHALHDEWQPLERAQVRPGDGILLRSTDEKYVWHVGVVVDACRFLHARSGAGVCVERYDSAAYARRIVAFYRYRGRPE